MDQKGVDPKTENWNTTQKGNQRKDIDLDLISPGRDIEDHDPKTEDHNPEIEGRDPETEDQDPEMEDYNPKIEVISIRNTDTNREVKGRQQ